MVRARRCFIAFLRFSFTWIVFFGLLDAVNTFRSETSNLSGFDGPLSLEWPGTLRIPLHIS